MTKPAACAWCGRAFTPRATGGHPQRFCRPPCRRSLDTAGRRWVADAMAAGALTVATLRSGYAATRVLAQDADSSGVDREDGKPASVAPPERPGETFLRITLDRMTAMQLRELRWGDPFHPATPEEMTPVVSALLRQAVPAFLMRR